jgi:hypothetical protein
LQQTSAGFLAHSGLARIKLFPKIAEALLGKRTGTRINPLTSKLVLPLNKDEFSVGTAPLKAIYVLEPPSSQSSRKRIVIRKLGASEAFVQLTDSTFVTSVTDPDRLRRQFELTTKLATAVSVKSLSYPRKLSILDSVLERIIVDLQD